MTGFVNRVDIANQSTVWDNYQNKTIWCGVCSIYDGKGGIERRVNDNCRLCCCLLKISFGEFKKIPMQNPFSRPLIDSMGKEFQKSEIGLQIERSDTSSDRVCHACARKMRLHNFISSSLQKEKQAIDVPDDTGRCKRLLPNNHFVAWLVSCSDCVQKICILISDVRSCSLVLFLGRFWLMCKPSEPMAMARTPAYWTNKKCCSSVQAVSQLSLSQAPHGFGTPYRGFPAFLSPSNCLKTAKLRRLATSGWGCACEIQFFSALENTESSGRTIAQQNLSRLPHINLTLLCMQFCVPENNSLNDGVPTTPKFNYLTLEGVYMITVRLSFRGEMKSCTVFT